jgi:hypothetical protein
VFQQFFERSCANRETAVDTLGLKEEHLILNDWIASKVVLFRFHNGNSFDGVRSQRQESYLYATALPKRALGETCVFSQFSQALTWNGLQILIGMPAVDWRVQSQQPQPPKHLILLAYKASFRAATVESVSTKVDSRHCPLRNER